MSAGNDVARAYRRSFASLCAGTIEQLLDATQPSTVPDDGATGPRHLDVGSGTGQLALSASRRGRRVHAADPDPGMVALTRRSLAPVGEDATVLEAASPVLPLPAGSFDAVTANFVVNHVHDPRASVRDLARVVRPTGRLALTVWPSRPAPHLAAYGEAQAAAGAAAVPSSRLPPELDFPRSAEGLAELAREAGLSIERAQELHWIWRIAADDLMAGIAGGVATPGRIHRAQTAAVREDIEARVRRLWSAYQRDGALAFPVTAVLVVARREP